MGEFSRTFGRGSEKPECYSDPEYYDADDEECIKCPFKAPCGLISSKKERAEQRKRSAPSASTRGKTYSKREKTVTGKIDSETFKVEDPNEDDTFSGAVLHNVSLNAVQAFTSTLDDAVSNIPRKGYRNLWNRNRKKKGE